MSYTDYTATEIGRRGQTLYDEQVRPLVESENRGKFLVLDIDTGDYEIDAEDLTASDRLLERKPEAIGCGLVSYQHTVWAGRRL